MTFKSIIASALLCTGLAGTLTPQAAQAGSDPFIGEIMMVGYTFCPRGWANANGQLLPIAQNTALFSLYGTQFGGDGRTTFGLPDMQGRVAMGQGRGPGLSQRNVGQKFGSETNTITINNMPSHNHGVSVTLNSVPTPGVSASPTGQMPALSSVGAIYGAGAGTAPMAANAATVTQQNQGGGQAMNNIQPTQVLRYCVALQGIFPSRN